MTERDRSALHRNINASLGRTIDEIYTASVVKV